MDLDLSQDQQLFQKTVRRFLEERFPTSRVRAAADEREPWDRAYWTQAASLGWTSLLAPQDLGGGGLAGQPLLDLVIVAEEMGRMVSPGPLVGVNTVAAALTRSGTPDQQRETLPGLADGSLVASWAFAEPDGRWDGAGIAAAAAPDGDSFVLAGTKAFVEDAARADMFLVSVRTGEGLSQFLVPAGTPGVTLHRRTTIDLTRRLGDVEFDGVRLPASTLVGRPGGAADDVEHQLQLAVVLQCAESAGAADRVFEFTLAYLFDRYSFGRPLASYQALKHRCADMKVALEACHGIVTGAARAVQASSHDAAELVSAAKSYIGERTVEIVQDCVQLHGGIGVTWEHDIHLFLRRVLLNRALYGSPADHRERLATLLAL